jgi:fumarylacetoacetase
VTGGVGFGVFSVQGDEPRIGFRVGHGILDLSAHGLGAVFEAPSLNPFLALGRASWEDTVARIVELVGAGANLVPLEDAELRLPFEVADYVDFYSSLEHASNLGRLFRPDSEPLLPNWRRLPVGYHGRAGTIVVSGTPVVRPWGQTRTPGEDEPTFGPSWRLDIELELGFVIGVGSSLGQPVPTSAFRDHVFGVVLVNDWSARDIQAWEYVPLGPNLGKSFQTSVSAWVTPLALLEEARVEAPAQDPAPLPHLAGGREWGLDVALEVELNGEKLSQGNARTLYWTLPQQLAHETSNGASLRTGDLMASGTISGAEPGTEGSMIELFRGERFLEDGDEIVLRGRAANGVELGEVRGSVLPARA